MFKSATTMTLYFRLFLFFPVVLAIVGFTVPLARDIGIFQFAMTVMIGGFIPYFIFVVLALYWSFKHKHTNHTKAFILAPFAFGACCFIYGLIQAYTNLSEPPNLFVAFGIALTVIGVVVSAAYSWSALGIWWLGLKLRN